MLACITAAGLLASRAHALEINRASQAQLESLRGVGVAMSERIVQARARAPFRDWTDLMQRVKGLRAASAERLSAQGLTVAGVAYDANAGAGAPAGAGAGAATGADADR